MTTAILIKESIYLEIAHSLRGFVHLHPGRESGGRHGVREVAESSTVRSIGNKKKKPLGLSWAFENLKAHPK